MSEAAASARVEHVGSLIRPAWLEGAELRRTRGELEPAQLQMLQDRAVTEALRRQADLGLAVVTDGELRRMPLLTSSAKGAESWQRGWAGQLVAGTHDESLHLVGDGHISPPPRRHAEALRVGDTAVPPAALQEYRYAAERTDRPVKISLLGPERAAQGLAAMADRSLYAHFDSLVADVIRIERDVVARLAAAGCTDIQLDVPGYAAYEDPISWAALRGRGVDPLGDLMLSVGADNAITEGTVGVTFGLHVCRRGLHGRWQQAIRNDVVAETMMTQLHFDRLLVDYGTQDTGFEQLRFVPRDKTVVLGLVSTTDERVETTDELVRRIEEASAYIDEDQLAISPQCGFAGPVGRHDVSEGAQWRKLEALLEAAALFWR